MSQETQPLATFIGFGSVCAEGLLDWSCLFPTAPSGRGQSVCKEHSGDPQIAVMANNWAPAGWQKDEGKDPTGLG